MDRFFGSYALVLILCQQEPLSRIGTLPELCQVVPEFYCELTVLAQDTAMLDGEPSNANCHKNGRNQGQQLRSPRLPAPT